MKTFHTYNSTTGEFILVGGKSYKGYAGRDEGLNNPQLEATKSLGPIPRGLWEIVEWKDSKLRGPICAVLSPVNHTAHGRSAFLIHGDNKLNNKSASHGCIVLSRPARLAIKSSPIKHIMVI